MKAKWNIEIFWLSFAIGGFIAITPLMSPLHEWGHYVFGDNVEIVGWNQVVYHGEVTIWGIMGGLLTEYYTGFALTWLFAIFGQHYRPCQSIAAGSFGYMNVTMFEALKSYDLNITTQRAGYDPGTIKLAWLVICLPMALIGWAVFKRLLRNP